MLPHETKKYFFDIAESSDLIAQFTAGKTLADYQNDPLLRSGVERQKLLGKHSIRLSSTIPLLQS